VRACPNAAFLEGRSLLDIVNFMNFAAAPPAARRPPIGVTFL
jgi:hypothetical protein